MMLMFLYSGSVIWDATPGVSKAFEGNYSESSATFG
jgi:hypothetical protein